MDLVKAAQSLMAGEGQHSYWGLFPSFHLNILFLRWCGGLSVKVLAIGAAVAGDFQGFQPPEASIITC